MKGKRKKDDVRQFQYYLSDNVHALHDDLVSQTYCHGGYYAFNISDPKPRNIHKASVRDRLLHHALYRTLYPFFDRIFIFDSYSCRVGKGTHKAINRFKSFAFKVSKNNTRTCWVLKCDVKKFFASINHEVLFSILQKYIPDENILRLLKEVVGSFSTPNNILTFLRKSECPKGLPLGNLTSQLLVNIYMSEFDQYVKHKLKIKHYIRYADDFVLLSHEKQYLEQTLRYIVVFLREKLKLELHPNKVSIQTFASGVDFLGWVHFSDHRVLRTTTKRRMLRRTRGLQKEDASVQSYLGMLKHGNAHMLEDKIGKI